MTESYSTEKLERLLQFLQGDADAVRLIVDLLYVAHLWDDLADKDVPRSDEDVNLAFLKAIGHIPLNPFYMRFQGLLAPLMHSTGISWLVSVQMERGSMDQKLNCFIARNAILNLMLYCLALVGGEDWAREQGPQFVQEFGPSYETFTEFLREFDDATPNEYGHLGLAVSG